jgi:SAM-dependent methyltransferase
MEMRVEDCPICGTAGSLLYPSVTDWVSGHFGNWGFRACSGKFCDALWPDPQPTPASMGGFYEGYHTHSGYIPRNSRILSFVWPNPYSARQNRIRTKALFTDLVPGKVLEIGCGSGQHLLEFQHRGWEVTGQDPDPVSAKNASEKLGIKVETRNVEKLGLEDGHFDLIFTHHVLEHVDNVCETLRVCRSLLKPGGTMVSFTPNAASFSRRIFKHNWRGLEAPRHRVLLGPVSAARVFEQAGFAQVEVTTFGTDGGILAVSSLSQLAKWSRAVRIRPVRIVLTGLCQIAEDFWGLLRPLDRWELCVTSKA